MFFTTLSDITPILKEVELSHEVKYFEDGLFDDKIIQQYHSAFDIENLGFTN